MWLSSVKTGFLVAFEKSELVVGGSTFIKVKVHAFKINFALLPSWAAPRKAQVKPETIHLTTHSSSVSFPMDAPEASAGGTGDTCLAL